MITRRDSMVAVISTVATVAVVARAQTVAKPVLHCGVFNWRNFKVEIKPSGERRQVFDNPTATLDRLECHITTFNPGQTPHTAHRHPEEEMMMLKEGTLEVVLHENQTNRLEADGINFAASNEWHGLRNFGTNPATYFVVRFFPPGLNTNRLDSPAPATSAVKAKL